VEKLCGNVGGGAWSTVVAHESAAVSVVESPAKGFCKGVGAVDATGDVGEDALAVGFPFLDGKMLDVDMTGAVGGFARIDHLDRCFVVDGRRWRSSVVMESLV